MPVEHQHAGRQVGEDRLQVTTCRLQFEAMALGFAARIVELARQYGRAKARLFHWPGLRHAVINLDDDFGVQLAASLDRSQVDVLGRKFDIIIASLSIIGIPPLAGDWPKYELMQGAIDSSCTGTSPSLLMVIV